MNLTRLVRDWVRTWIPLPDLLPDKLPAYVRSPAYYFGILSVSSLVLLVLSGFTLAFFGPQWWHVNDVGHFVNSVHFWSTQAFFFGLAAHLWTEFCKGAWRHGRRLTWMLGVLSFFVAIGTAFTGYLSQTNFDSQWIAVNGKDAMNAVGIGSFFNLMDFGQMYGLHVVLLPLAVVALVGLHLLLVRIRGVVRPYAATTEDELAEEQRWGGTVGPGWSPLTAWLSQRRPRHYARPLASDQEAYYCDLCEQPYDLIGEGVIALTIVAALALLLAGVLSSPDEPPITIQQYAQQSPVQFLREEMDNLRGTSYVATYGPPYNDGTAQVQYLGPFSPQLFMGITIPIDAAEVYVLRPLSELAKTDPAVAAALRQFNQANESQQEAWMQAYADALPQATASNGEVVLPTVEAGPLPVLMGSLLAMGQSGALEGLLLQTRGFYQADFTRPLLFLNSQALPAKAEQLKMLDTQWGVMNETGNYPGQPWLWLYTLWYQIPPYNTSPNADILVWVTMAILSGALLFYPYIPYLNRLPYYLGIHRLIWREYYQDRDRLQARPGQEGGQTRSSAL